MKPGTRHQRGQAFVEVALLLTLFLGLLIGIMDWSWTMFVHESLTWRAARAARWAAVRPFNSDTVQGARNLVLYGSTSCTGCSPAFALNDNNVTVTQQSESYTVDNGTTTDLTSIVVRVSGYQIIHFTPFYLAGQRGRTITATQLWECVDADCTKP